MNGRPQFGEAIVGLTSGIGSSRPALPAAAVDQSRSFMTFILNA